MEKLSVSASRCWNVFTDRSSCDACVRACPRDCITLEPGPAVASEACVSCGLCATSCPSAAITFPALYGQRFLSGVDGQTLSENTVVLTCPGYSDQWRMLESSGFCLGGLEPAMLISLLEKGARHIQLDTSRCGQCRLSAGKKAVEDRVASTQAWLELLGMEGRVSVVSHSPQNGNGFLPDGFLAREESLSRRNLFRRVGSRGLTEVARKINLEEAQEDDSPRAGTPIKRRVLLEFLQKNQGETGVPEFPERLEVRQVKANADCTLCGSCARLCPTGALEMEENKKKSSLFFLQHLCVGCEHCEKLCHYNALESRELVAEDFPLASLAEKRMIFARIKAKCSACDRPFVTVVKRSTCPSCEKLNKVDDSIMKTLNW